MYGARPSGRARGGSVKECTFADVRFGIVLEVQLCVYATLYQFCRCRFARVEICRLQICGSARLHRCTFCPWLPWCAQARAVGSARGGIAIVAGVVHTDHVRWTGAPSNSPALRIGRDANGWTELAPGIACIPWIIHADGARGTGRTGETALPSFTCRQHEDGERNEQPLAPHVDPRSPRNPRRVRRQSPDLVQGLEEAMPRGALGRPRDGVAGGSWHGGVAYRVPEIATPRRAGIARRGVIACARSMRATKNSGSDLLSHTETVQYHRLWRA